MIIMASLKSGVLVKLLEDMNLEENVADNRKPVLLQIRSIVPVLEEGDLWPNKFYLKVSDSSHAMYVSLPQEQDEMILSNKLQLGQFINVQNLEEAIPVPILQGVTPVPGRRPCYGTPEDIAPMGDLGKLLDEVSDTESIMEKGVISEKKISGFSDSESVSLMSDGGERMTRGKFRSLSASKAWPNEHRKDLNCSTKRCHGEKRNLDVLGGIRRSKSCSVDNGSDSDSPKSSVSSVRITKRRSWNEIEFLGVEEIFDSSTVKQKSRPVGRSRSACVSPVRSIRYDSSDDNSSSTTRKHHGQVPKSIRSSKQTKTVVSRKICEVPSYPTAKRCSANDQKLAESRVLWDSLPSSLAKLGKEVILQRNAALLAAVEALQEACAAERLIKCLSKYSEFLTTKVDDLQPSIDKFFDLQDDLAHSKQVVQSLTNISPLRTSDTDSNSSGSIKDALSLALERKKNATSWIKSAVAFDLSPVSTSLKPITQTSDTSKTVKKSSITSHSVKQNGAFIRTQRKNGEIPIGLASEKDEPRDWLRGNALCASADLANSLHDESQKWFLGNVDKFLDEIERKSTSMESDTEIASTMYQIKRVNDWLELVVGKESGRRESSKLEDSEIEACEKVKNKIYGVLLKHVERTAMALEI